MKAKSVIYNVPLKTHNRMVEHAKTLLKHREEAKWEICKIALKVCYIPPKKGGRYDGKYSITNFAEDIKMHRKTLSCWILDYQAVYVNLKIDESNMSYSQIKKLNGAISSTRRKLFNFDKISKEQINRETKETVQNTFNEFIHEDALTHRLRSFITNLSHHTYTFKNEKFLSKHKALVEEYKKQLNLLYKEVNK
jgi:hypothetical protein